MTNRKKGLWFLLGPIGGLFAIGIIRIIIMIIFYVLTKITESDLSAYSNAITWGLTILSLLTLIFIPIGVITGIIFLTKKDKNKSIKKED